MTSRRSLIRPPNTWLIVCLGCFAVGLLDALQILVKPILAGEVRENLRPAFFQFFEWSLFGLLTTLPYLLGKQFPLRRRGLGIALLVHAIAAFVLANIWAFFGVVVRRALGLGWDMPFREERHDWTLITIPWSYILYFAVLGTFSAFTYYQEARERELHATQLSGQLSEARLRALRAQLQPHFLFNALNAVTVLVRDRRNDTAERILDQLSDMLRQVLRTDLPHLIPLREEMELVRQYLGIEQVRFSDRLRITYDVSDAALDGLVPSFILQPLIENAFRHGLADRLEDGVLEVGARRVGDRLQLWVRDNGVGLRGDVVDGIGLSNTRERLVTLFGASATVELRANADGSGAIAMVDIPWQTETT